MELRDAHITAAAESSDAMRALLARFVTLAAPAKGAPIILAALARLGTTGCDWIEGELTIVVKGDETWTTIMVSTSMGGGFAEKILPDTRLRVPFSEFKRAVAVAPKLLEPLTLHEAESRIVLTATSLVRKTTSPPPAVDIDAKSLLTPSRDTPPYALPVVTAESASSGKLSVPPGAPKRRITEPGLHLHSVPPPPQMPRSFGTEGEAPLEHAPAPRPPAGAPLGRPAAPRPRVVLRRRPPGSDDK